MAFWDTYEQLCNERGISPQSKELRDFIGVSSSTMTGWKKDGIFPKVEYLIQISVFFDVSLEYLVGRTSTKKPITKLDEREEVMLSAFRLADEKGRARITQVALNEADRSEEERKKYAAETPTTTAG